MSVIALDVMGGDHAPVETISGAILAAKEYDVTIQLVGPEPIIKDELKKYNIKNLSLEIINAVDIVEMGDKQPAISVKKKKDASIVVAMNQVASGSAHGVVSAGSTGATCAAALLCLKRIEGVDRPCLSAVLPSLHNPYILADAGANVEATKEQLLQNAFMGVALAKSLFKIENPRVGLLNIGEEPGKGNNLVKEAFELISSVKTLNFIGNVEGRAVAENICDVCVTDGFVGNVFLKTAEGYAKLVTTLLRNELTKDIKGKLGALLSRNSFYRLKKRVDYSEYGGGQLLGVKGICVVAHGSSHAFAIKNAIRIAHEAYNANLLSLTELLIKASL